MNQKYLQGKENARQEAIDFQACFEEFPGSFSYSELEERLSHFEKMAHRYGLVKEFKKWHNLK